MIYVDYPSFSSNRFERGENIKSLLTELMTGSRPEKAYALATWYVKKNYKGC